MRYFVGPDSFDGGFYVQESGVGSLEPIATLDQLVKFWKAGHQVASATDESAIRHAVIKTPPPKANVPPGRSVLYHETFSRLDSDEPSEPISVDAAVAEIHAIKKRLADIVSGLAPGSSLTISISKEPR